MPGGFGGGLMGQCLQSFLFFSLGHEGNQAAWAMQTEADLMNYCCGRVHM